MKLYLTQIRIRNRAPFGDLDLAFRPAEVAILSALNGRGKTTVLSYITDALYELAKAHFSDVAPSQGAFYRISSGLDRLNQEQPSIVYVRFASDADTVDHVDLRAPCSAEQYAALVDGISTPIPFDNFAPILAQGETAKVHSPNWSKQMAERYFRNNVLTLFPAYRFETPSYLNDAFQRKLRYNQSYAFTGELNKPIECVTAFPEIANWLMDVILDSQLYPQDERIKHLRNVINIVLTLALSAKGQGALRLGIGPRNNGPTRIQVYAIQANTQVYPTIFRLSSGEQALLTVFMEILRQADRATGPTLLPEISGVVLIDEIDKHLHIKLQKEVLPALIGIFPNVQFIASSHSPFLGMGLAEFLPERARILDISSGLPLAPRTDPLYQEVYELMLNEEAKFKTLYTDLQQKLDASKRLQLITEGANTEHILKALAILAPDILPSLHVVSGAESKSGAQQLKNAFEIMSSARHAGHFLFVWDCDVDKEFEGAREANNCWKYRLPLNAGNTKTPKGIENMYFDDLFTADVYDTYTVAMPYGGKNDRTEFNKKKFLDRIRSLTVPHHFANYAGLVEKIRAILAGS